MRTHSTHISPFTTAHCGDAARLLDARHRADRARELALPTAPPGQLQLELEAALGDPRTLGVAAVRDGRLVGYLLGTSMLLPATDPLAAFFAPRSARVPYIGHAVEASDADLLYRALYAALAADWTQRGIFAHYVQLPAADAGALTTWHALGFGLDMGLALRDTRPLTRASAIDNTIHIRRAGTPDSAAVWELERALARHEAGAPVFFPALPEAEPVARAELELQLANPATHCWLAEHRRDGRALGMLTCVPPPRHLPPLLTPARTVNIASCAVDPAARGLGVGTALLAHTLTWARDAGHDWLRLTWMTANPLSSRF